MPPLTKYLAWMVIAACPAGLLAQMPGSHGGEFPRPEMASAVPTNGVPDGSGVRGGLQQNVPSAAVGSSNPVFGTAGQAASGAPRLDASGPQSNAATSIPLPAPRHEAPVALSPKGRSGRGDASKPPGGLTALLTMGGSLVLVLGLFFIVTWLLRRTSSKGSALLPGEVVEVLGRAPLAGRQQMHLLRCGNKLLLVSVTPTGAETLTEVTDPLEVDRLAGLCRQAQPHSATATFRRVFQQLGSPGENRDA